MKKKTKSPAPLPNVNIFCSVSHDVWRSLTVIAALSGIGRLKVYAIALEWAVKDEAFRDHVLDLMDAWKLKVRK